MGWAIYGCLVKAVEGILCKLDVALALSPAYEEEKGIISRPRRSHEIYVVLFIGNGKKKHPHEGITLLETSD